MNNSNEVIIWQDEELAGQPAYNILPQQGAAMYGVSFALENAVLVQGTPFSAENMEKLMQVEMSEPSTLFFYNGADVPTIPSAPDESGVLLAKCYAGAKIYAQGVVYVTTDSGTQRLINPMNYEVTTDALLCCGLGEEVYGVVERRRLRVISSALFAVRRPQ